MGHRECEVEEGTNCGTSSNCPTRQARKEKVAAPIYLQSCLQMREREREGEKKKKRIGEGKRRGRMANTVGKMTET